MTAADDPDEAERYLRGLALSWQSHRGGELIAALLTEYDRRGTELAQATFANKQHWQTLADTAEREGRARREWDRLAQQRRAALLLHPPEVLAEGTEYERVVCGTCIDGGEEPLAWPCPTAAALGAPEPSAEPGPHDDRPSRAAAVVATAPVEPLPTRVMHLSDVEDWEALAAQVGGHVHSERDISDEYVSELVIPGVSGNPIRLRESDALLIIDQSAHASTTPDPAALLAEADVEPLREAIRVALDNFPFEGGPDLWHVTDQIVHAVLNVKCALVLPALHVSDQET